jgi:biofilm PGA synthesis N-glycosyltransferase PgaC
VKKSTIFLAVVALIIYGLVLVVSPDISTIIAAVAGIVVAIVFFGILVARTKSPFIQRISWLNTVPLFIIFLAVPITFAVLLFIQGKLSIILILVMVSLAFSFFYGFLNIPLAVYHKYEEKKIYQRPLSRYPPISVIVPAHNEEKCIAGTIETLLEAYYPVLKEIIVVDDGSTDGTYDIAKLYISRGVKVVQRPQGGKAAALNTGLQFAQGEVIVCVDADSMVARTALYEIVRRFEYPDVVAIAGNVKVLNRKNLLAACQALEYVFDINISRRAMDIFGAVIVVPGCLGAFRSKALKLGGGWDVQTIVEDFDTTVKLFKSGAFDTTNPLAPVDLTRVLQHPDIDVVAKGMKGGSKIVQASSEAIVYTEAPENLKGLWKQRLRWYRGNFQTLLKHKDAFRNPRFGTLYNLAFPYMLISMLFIPISTIVIIITAILAILAGEIIPLLLIFAVFVVLQSVVSVLAIELDNEDLRLAFYSIFFVLGYKHILDAVKLKAAFDVLTKQKMGWDKLERIGLFQKRSI